MYVSELLATSFPNPDYRGEKLKRKLETFYANKLKFILMDTQAKFKTFNVYNSEIELASAVLSAYKLRTKDVLHEVGRKIILEAFNKAHPLPWPPIANILDGMDGVTPVHLKTFLSIVISGQKDTTSLNVKRLVHSIGQDICQAVTNGHWNLLKHIVVLYV